MVEIAPGGRLRALTAIVTGSTTGIGECIARRFALEGARVIVHGPDETEAEGIATDIRRGRGDAVAVGGDLSDPSVPGTLVARAIKVLGHVDILVNNAALKTRTNLETTDAAAFDRILAVNLRAPLLLARALLPHFRARRDGAILNIGSVNAYCGEPDLLAYSISKGGLMTLTRNLADAHSMEGIRVNQLNLGWVLTPGEDELRRAEGFPAGWPERLPPGVAPSGTLLRPDEVAHFALAFVEQSARRVSGAVVDLEQYPLIGRNPPKALSFGPSL
jgi:NAD(P)-dependent dehydrogenase (short-subunit alcohol dehydrogenase family)